jgi:hypothetical protein
LKRHQIEKIIKNFHNVFGTESNKFIVAIVNKFKEIA